MRAEQAADTEAFDALTAAIYDAALEPARWAQVMGQVRTLLRTGAETFYHLDFGNRRTRVAHLSGITSAWFACFDTHYYSQDNPWRVLSGALHRPGVVRTNERLEAYARDAQILYRSQYYNEWLRPQGLHASLGNTLVSDGDAIVNVTLLRHADQPTFDVRDVRLFERLTLHFRQALSVARRFDGLAVQRDGMAEAIDRLPEGMLLLDGRARVLHANAAAQALLARSDGLVMRAGMLAAAFDADQPRLQSLLRPLLGGLELESLGPVSVALRRRGGRGHLTLSATALRSRQDVYQSGAPCILLMVLDPHAARVRRPHLLRQRYQFTPAETRLAQALLEGASLRDAASQLGITYGTARDRIKLLFHKTDTRRQSELVVRLLRDAADPLLRIETAAEA